MRIEKRIMPAMNTRTIFRRIVVGILLMLVYSVTPASFGKSNVFAPPLPHLR